MHNKELSLCYHCEKKQNVNEKSAKKCAKEGQIREKKQAGKPLELHKFVFTPMVSCY